MRTVRGLDVKVDTDDTGTLVNVSWHCPYCADFNAGMSFVSNNEIVKSGMFILERECDSCGKMVAIECTDVEPLF